MVTIKHTVLFQLHQNDAHARYTTAKLVHKAATVTFNNSHIAWVINTWHRPNQNKKKEKENTLLLCKVCLQS